jgi:hypothetical protein
VRCEVAGAIAEGVGFNKGSASEPCRRNVIRVAAGIVYLVRRTHHFRCEWLRIADNL